MHIRRSLPILIGVLLVAGAVALVVVLRKHAPPEPARLLPGAEGFVYVDLKWMRRANLLGNLPQVSHEPEYERFIQATGIEAERDLEEAALAVHYPPNMAGARAEELRFSEVLVGHFQAERLSAYLRKAASAVESYRSTEIYNIPLENRTLRVAVLAVNTLAGSNAPDPQVIRGIIDRSRKLASPFGGPALLRQYYKEVPLASLAWAVVRVNPGPDTSGAGFLGWSFLFPKPAVVVASARYLGAVHLKAAAFTENQEDAAQLSQKVGTFLNLFRTAQNTTSAPGPDPDVRALFDSLKVQQEKNRVVVTAVAPIGFVRKVFSEAPTGVSAVPSQPTVPPALPAVKSKKR
jgi:hypothetical protein